MTDGADLLRGMGVHGTGEAVNRILRRPAQSHPFAHGSWGYWVVQRRPAPPLGWILTRDLRGVWVFDCYARCRDSNGLRPWLRTEATLNSAVAWMLQHDREISALIARSAPEPD